MIALLLVCAVGPFVKAVDAFGDPLPPHAVARLGTQRFRLEGPVVAADVTSDGQIVALTEGRQVTLLDAGTGDSHGRVAVEKDVTGLRFSPDGRRLVAFGPDALTVIDVRKRSVETTIEPKGGRVLSAAVSGDGERIVYAQQTGRFNGQIEVYSVPDRRSVRSFSVSDFGRRLFALHGMQPPVMLALSPKGDRLAAVTDPFGGKRNLKLWDVASGKELKAPEVTATPTGALAFSPDGKTLAVAGLGEQSVLWSLDTNKRLGPLGKDTGVVAAAFSTDGKWVAALLREGGVNLYDARNGDRVRRAGFPPATTPMSVRVLSDGTALALGVAGHTVRLVSSRAKAEVPGHFGPVRTLAFAADGRGLYTSSLDGVRWWDTADWRPAGEFDPISRKRSAYGESVTFLSPTGRYAFTTTPPDRIRVDDWADRKHLGEVACDALTAPALSAGDARAAFVGASRVDVVELPSRAHVRTVAFPFNRLSPHGVALSPDGLRVVVCGLDDDTDNHLAYLYDVATGRLRGRFRLPGSVGRPAFSPDGRWLALPAAEEISVKDAATLDTVASLPLAAGTVAPVVAFSPDSRLLAVAREQARQPESNPADVAVYELASRKERWTFPGRAQALAFSPDSRRLAAGVSCAAVVYDLSGLSVARQPARPRDRWAALEGGAADAAAAMDSLALDPSGAVALLEAKLKPAEGRPLSLRVAKRLVLDLRDPEKRVRAELLLGETGPRLIGLLADMGEEFDHPDAKLSLRGLVREARAWPGEGMLGAVRAIEVLERLRTPEARRLLEGLAAGNADARLTVEAQAALRRMRP